MKLKIMSILSAVLLGGCSVVGIRTTEEPKFEVIESEGDFEVRQYETYLVAKTTVTADYEESTSKGFRRLANYIFGDNIKEESITMTAPVIQEEKNEEISMTAPVIREMKEGKWEMRFVMPAEYTMETLPTPTDTLVTLEEEPAKKMAVKSYSGFMSEEKFESNKNSLLKWIEEKGYSAIAPPLSAGYDPPWTIPFLRRNEVMVEIK